MRRWSLEADREDAVLADDDGIWVLYTDAIAEVARARREPIIEAYRNFVALAQQCPACRQEARLAIEVLEELRAEGEKPLDPEGMP